MKCVRTNGVCASTTYPNAPGPSETALVPFSSQDQAQWVVIDANNPLPDVNGKVPNPGVYVLVATYKQNNPGMLQIQNAFTTLETESLNNAIIFVLQK